MRVLIADDSPLVVERLVAMLAKVRGVEVVGQAGNGTEASEAIRRLKPDVVILDMCMPGGSGVEVLERLKSEQLTPVVIMLTGYGEARYRKKCLERGAKFFLDKYDEFEKVPELLRSLVAGAPLPGSILNERAEFEEEGSGSRSRTHFIGGARSQQEGIIATAKPKLLLGNAGKGEPVYYICSHCLRGFLLPDNQPPIQAAKELYHHFRKHVEQDHPEPADGAITEGAA
jgi:DNA-binding NarL/FixJ family response regulator